MILTLKELHKHKQQSSKRLQDVTFIPLATPIWVEAVLVGVQCLQNIHHITFSLSSMDRNGVSGSQEIRQQKK